MTSPPNIRNPAHSGHSGADSSISGHESVLSHCLRRPVKTPATGGKDLGDANVPIIIQDSSVGSPSHSDQPTGIKPSLVDTDDAAKALFRGKPFNSADYTQE